MYKNKEPGPYFHLSLDDDFVEDLFDLNIGYYKVPTMAYYGESYPYGDMLGIVKSSGFRLNLPENVTNIIQSVEETYMTYPPPNKKGKWTPKPVHVPFPESIDFYWIVSNISELKEYKGTNMNLVNHAWAITDFHGQRRFKHIPTCILPISGVRELDYNGVKFNELRAEYISMHFKQGCLSISPNNQKVNISPRGVNKFWTICICDDQPKAVISLQWVLTDNSLNSVFEQSKSLNEVLGRLNDPLLNFVFQSL